MKSNAQHKPMATKKGGSRTRKHVMGHQGKPAMSKPSHFMNKSTGRTAFGTKKKA